MGLTVSQRGAAGRRYAIGVAAVGIGAAVVVGVLAYSLARALEVEWCEW